jgi:hypothetical protein
MLRLPFFWRDNGPIYAWPPPTPPLLASIVVPPGPGPDWQADIKARNAALREESERLIAHYRQRDRERQERELKEGKEAIAREVAERNRRNGWPYWLRAAREMLLRCPQSAKGDIRSFER